MKQLQECLEKLRKLELPFRENLHMDEGLCKIKDVEKVIIEFYNQLNKIN